MDLTAAIPRLLYSGRNRLLFQSRSRCSELKPGARKSKCLTLLQYWVIWGSLSQLGSLWCSCSGRAIISYWEPNTIACLLVCSWGLCLFFPSSAQTQLHCSVAWGIYSWPDSCSLRPPRLQGIVLIPRELKQHLRRWKFQNPFSRLKKAGVPFGAVLPWGITAFSLCSVKENGKSGKPFENGRFLPFPSANGMTQPELRLLPSPGSELLPPIPVYRGRCGSATAFPGCQGHCRGEDHAKSSRNQARTPPSPKCSAGQCGERVGLAQRAFLRARTEDPQAQGILQLPQPEQVLSF